MIFLRSDSSKTRGVNTDKAAIRLSLVVPRCANRFRRLKNAETAISRPTKSKKLSRVGMPMSYIIDEKRSM